MSFAPATWTLVGPDGGWWRSNVRGTFGGHRKSRIYGRLDCAFALRAIGKGVYVAHRVFFLDEQAAQAAGYRPCAKCLPGEYERWKGTSTGAPVRRPRVVRGRAATRRKFR